MGNGHSSDELIEPTQLKEGSSDLTQLSKSEQKIVSQMFQSLQRRT